MAGLTEGLMEDQGQALISKVKAKLPAGHTQVTSWAYSTSGPDGKPADESSMVCHLCKHSITAKRDNTTTLFSHLNKQHPKEFANLKAGSRASTDATETSSSRLQQACIQPQQTLVEVITKTWNYPEHSHGKFSRGLMKSRMQTV